MTRLVPFAAGLVLFVTLADPRPTARAGADAALVARARAIHERVITLDTDDDINPDNFTRQKNDTQRLETQSRRWPSSTPCIILTKEIAADQIAHDSVERTVRGSPRFAAR